jgi:hypothetical protein
MSRSAALGDQQEACQNQKGPSMPAWKLPLPLLSKTVLPCVMGRGGGSHAHPCVQKGSPRPSDPPSTVSLPATNLDDTSHSRNLAMTTLAKVSKAPASGKGGRGLCCLLLTPTRPPGLPWFTCMETEAQRGEMSGPRSQSYLVVALGLSPFNGHY